MTALNREQRPTLEEQIAISKLTVVDYLKLLKAPWLYTHFNFLWRVIHWNWWVVKVTKDNTGNLVDCGHYSRHPKWLCKLLNLEVEK